MQKIFSAAQSITISLLVAGPAAADETFAGHLLSPFFASPAALWSTVGVFVLSLLVSAILFGLGVFKAKREKETIDLVDYRIKNKNHSQEILYHNHASDLSSSGLLGDNPIDRRRRLATSTGRILSMLHSDAKMFRYQPVHLAIRAEESGIRNYSRKISTIQTLALRTGILGTFIGLILSLRRVQEVFLLRGSQFDTHSAIELEKFMSEIGDLMREVVEGLTLAFGTSISGIAAAILISFIAAAARWREDLLTGKIHDVASKAQRLFRETSSFNEALAQTVEELNESLKDNLSTLADVRADIYQHGENLQTAAKTVASGLSEPVQLFAEQTENIKAMLTASRDAAQNSARIAEQMQSIETATIGRMENLNRSLEKSISQSAQTLQTALDADRTALHSELREISSTISEALTRATQVLSEGMEKQLGESLRGGITESMQGFMPGLAVREVIASLQRESRRKMRHAFAVYLAAIMAVTTIQIASLHWSELQNLLSSNASASPAPLSQQGGS